MSVSAINSQAFRVQNSKYSRSDNGLTPFNPRETSWMPNTRRAEKKTTCFRQSEKNKSDRSSQCFSVQNSKHSRPNYGDLTCESERDLSGA